MSQLSPRVRVAAWVAAGVLGGGLVTGVAVSELGVASAASPSPSPRASAGTHHSKPLLRRFFERRMRGHLGGLGPAGGPGLLFGVPGLGAPGLEMGRVLHGEATVQTPNGTKVMSTQLGNITSVAGAQVTVRSSDGFTRTYSVDKQSRISLDGADGASSRLKTGDTVRVLAVKSGNAWSARAVIDGLPVLPKSPPRPGAHGPAPGMAG